MAAGMVRARISTADSLRPDVKALRDILATAAKMRGADPARIAEVQAEVDRMTGS
jgi:hypothetical protein